MTKKKHPPEAAPMDGETAVVVCTEHRGVFFGYTRDTQADPMQLRRMRNCVRWVAEQKGFVGLATKGPLPGTKIGPAADCDKLTGITCVLLAQPEAMAAWEDAPW